MRYPPDFVLICSAIFGTLMAGSAFGLASVAWGDHGRARVGRS